MSVRLVMDIIDIDGTVCVIVFLAAVRNSTATCSFA